MNHQSQTKQLAVITGASKGIGFEIAKIFAEEGYDLVVNSSSDSIYEAVSDLEKYGTEVIGIKADLATREGADTLYEKVKSLDRKTNVLILNAGIGAGGEFIKKDFEEEMNVMNLNIIYLVYLTKKFITDMVASNEGKILFTSSLAAEMPAPYNAVYAATKSFVQSFSAAIRFEMQDTNKDITITAFQPGPTDTDFFERAHMENTSAGQDKKDDPSKVAREGFDALMSEDDNTVVGSLKNKIGAAAAQIMPESMRAKIHGNLSKPNELKQ